MMNNDPIVGEVRKAREEILESYAWNIEAMMRDMMKLQWDSGHAVVSMPPEKHQEGSMSDAEPFRKEA
jgi:hypothetical protein